MTIEELRNLLTILVNNGQGDVQVCTQEEDKLFAVEEVWITDEIDEDSLKNNLAIIGGGGFICHTS